MSIALSGILGGCLKQARKASNFDKKSAMLLQMCFCLWPVCTDLSDRNQHTCVGSFQMEATREVFLVS